MPEIEVKPLGDLPQIPYDMQDIGAVDDDDFDIEDGQPRWIRGLRQPRYRRHRRPASSRR